MKQRYAETSNKQLNVQMTEKQWDVVSFIAFESETSIIYPFSIKFNDVTMEMIDKIINECNECKDDTDALYSACECILGVN